MIKAIGDKIVTVLMKRTKTSGGIILPETAQEPQAYCKVISVGDKVEKINEGDIIVAHIRAGMDSVIGHSFLKILKEEEVYGTLTDEDTLENLEVIELQKSEPQEKTNIIQAGGTGRIIRPA